MPQVVPHSPLTPAARVQLPDVALSRHGYHTFGVGEMFWFGLIHLNVQYDNGYIDGRSQKQVHTDERAQVHAAWSSLVDTHPSINVCN